MADVDNLKSSAGWEADGTLQVLQRDDDALDKAPQVLQDDIKSGSPKGSRAYSTSTRRQQEALISFEDDGIETTGHKFGLPELPLPSTSNMKHRYDPVVVQVTNLLMRDGKLSVAQRVCRQLFCPYMLSS